METKEPHVKKFTGDAGDFSRALKHAKTLVVGRNPAFSVCVIEMHSKAGLATEGQRAKARELWDKATEDDQAKMQQNVLYCLSLVFQEAAPDIVDSVEATSLTSGSDLLGQLCEEYDPTAEATKNAKIDAVNQLLDRPLAQGEIFSSRAVKLDTAMRDCTRNNRPYDEQLLMQKVKTLLSNSGPTWQKVSLELSLKSQSDPEPGKLPFPQSWQKLKQFIVNVETDLLRTGILKNEKPVQVGVHLTESDLRHTLKRGKKKWCARCKKHTYHTTEEHWDGPGPPPITKAMHQPGPKLKKHFKNPKSNSSKKKGQKTTSTEKRTCFKCGKPGHLAAACKSKKLTNKKSTRGDNSDGEEAYMVSVLMMSVSTNSTDGVEYVSSEDADEQTVFLHCPDTDEDEGPPPLVEPGYSSEETDGGSPRQPRAPRPTPHFLVQDSSEDSDDEDLVAGAPGATQPLNSNIFVPVRQLGGNPFGRRPTSTSPPTLGVGVHHPLQQSTRTMRKDLMVRPSVMTMVHDEATAQGAKMIAKPVECLIDSGVLGPFHIMPTTTGMKNIRPWHNKVRTGSGLDSVKLQGELCMQVETMEGIQKTLKIKALVMPSVPYPLLNTDLLVDELWGNYLGTPNGSYLQHHLTGERIHLRSKFDHGVKKKGYWVKCVILDEEAATNVTAPEKEHAKVMLVDPSIDSTGRLLPEYRTQDFGTHLSLGHIYNRSVKRARKGDMFDESGLPWSKIPCIGTEKCYICATAKLTNRHEQHNQHEHTQPLWSINVDTIGPFRAVGLRGEKQALVFSDAGSNMCVVEPVCKRVEYYSKLPSVVNALNALHPKYKVMEISGDNASEFGSQRAQQLYDELHVSGTSSAPYSAWQNRAEGTHRRLLDRTRCMMTTAATPPCLFYDCLKHAGKLINISPCSSNPKSVSPYFMVTGKKVKLAEFPPWGCFMAGWLAKPRRVDPKLANPSVSGVFAGNYFMSEGGVTKRGFKIWAKGKLWDCSRVKYDPTYFPLRADFQRKDQSWSDFTAEMDLERTDSHTLATDSPPPLIGEGGADDMDSGVRVAPMSSDLDSAPVAVRTSERVKRMSAGSSAPQVTEARAPDGTLAENYINVEVGVLNNGIIELGKVFDWDYDAQGKLIWGLELENEVRYVSFDDLLLAQKIAAHLPQAMMLAREEVAILAHKQGGEDWPKGYKAAMKSPEAELWKAAIKRELDQLMEKEVWRVVDRPPKPARVIPTMFRFTKHPKEAKKKHEHKARGLVDGSFMREGIDYFNSFSATASGATILLIMAVATACNMLLESYDIAGAFTYSPIEETVYIEPFPGMDIDPSKCLLLLKALYGLCQAPRAFKKLFVTWLYSIGMVALDQFECCFLWTQGKDRLIMGIHVDDGVLAATSRKIRDKFYKLLHDRFKVSMESTLEFYLGLNIRQDLAAGTTFVGQKTYIDKVLRRFDEYITKESNIPMEPSFKINPKDLEVESEPELRKLFSSIIGSLMYAARWTQVHLLYSVCSLARVLHNPAEKHVRAAIKILEYLKKHSVDGLRFTRGPWYLPREITRFAVEPLVLVAMSDAAWADDLIKRRSTAAYYILFCGAVVSGRSHILKTVAGSSLESEYMALYYCGVEVVYLRNVLDAMGFKQDSPTKIYCDNEAVKSFSEDAKFRDRTRHIDIKYHKIREWIEQGQIEVVTIRGSDNPADIGTKPLSKGPFHKHKKVLLNE